MFRLSLVPFYGRSVCRLSRNLNTGNSLHKNVAVVLSGSGVYDGTEIHEASAVLVHLSRADININIYAPDIPQMHVVNHTNGEVPEGETRNVLVESARIARGKISPLSDLDVSAHDAVVFPGGFGAAKNLSSFAVDGANCKVNEEVAKIIKAFHAAKKPIGLCCIAPVLAAKTIPGCHVTLGQDLEDGGKWPYAGATTAVKEMGANHINKDVDEVNIDEKNKIVTTPAFMCETKVHHIHDGIGKMIHAVLSLIK